jgi:uncharacterized protein YndB with AHSA1/START domain
MSESKAIVIVEDYAASPARVWRAMTDPALMERWMMANDFVPRVGHEFTMQGVPVPAVKFSGMIRCTVLELVAEKRLSLSWGDAAGARTAWTVSWTLEPRDSGTRVTLVHDGFDLTSPEEQVSYKVMGSGWVGIMKKLGAVAGELGLAA